MGCVNVRIDLDRNPVGVGEHVLRLTQGSRQYAATLGCVAYPLRGIVMKNPSRRCLLGVAAGRGRQASPGIPGGVNFPAVFEG